MPDEGQGIRATIAALETITDDGQVDWEAKFQKAVSTNVRQSQMHKEKSAGWLRDLQVATQRIADLEGQVKDLTPAGNRYAALQVQLAETERHWAERVSELKEQNAKLAKLAGQSQREVLETMATWLQGQINRLPAPEEPQTNDDKRRASIDPGQLNDRATAWSQGFRAAHSSSVAVNPYEGGTA